MNRLNVCFNRTGWILVIICITGLVSGMGTMKADWCYEEGFEGGGTGLWSDPGIINTTETAAVGEHSIKLEGCSIYPVGTELPCPEGNRPEVISWWCRAGTLHDCLAVNICPTGSHGMGDLSFHLNHGQFILLAQDVYYGLEYNLNQWYFLELYIDWSGEQPVFNMYCDDVLMISNAEPSPWVEFNDVEKIQLEVNCGYSWVDDVKVEQEVQPTATPTETPIPTNTPVPTDTPTNTPEPTCTPTDTPVPTCTPTDTPIPTCTPTDTPEPTSTPTDTPEPTCTPTDTPEPTCTPTDTPIPTITPTPSGCLHRIELYDDGGNGWQNGEVMVYVDNAQVPGSPFTLEDGYGPVSFTFYCDTDITLTTMYNYGGCSHENAYIVYDGLDNVLFATGQQGTTPSSWMGGHGNCDEPTPTPTDTPIPTATPTDTPEPTCTPTDTPIPTNTPGIPCEHRLYLTDSGHDGWNDGYVDVYVNGLMVLDGATIESIPEKDQKELHWMNYYFDAADNTLIEVEYYQGSYQPEEHAYVVYDGMQNVVCESGGNGTIPENTCGPGNCSVYNPTPIPSGTPEPTSTPDPVCYNDGDVNNDGSLSATDAQMAFLYAVGFETPDPEQACSADCNGNGSISAGDALSIFMATVGVDSCTDDIPVKRMNNAIQSVSNNLKSETWNAGTIELEYDLTLDNRLEVTLYLDEENTPVDAFMMEWTVNPDVLRLAGYACTDLTCQWTMLYVQEMSKNTIRIAGFDVGHDDEFHANQAFLKLYFDILDYTIDLQGLIPLKLTGVADDLTDYVIQ